MSTPTSQKVRTPEFRASFLHIFEREQKPTGEEGSYSLVAMFPKKSADWRKDLPWLWEAVKATLLAKYPSGQGMPPMFKDYGVDKPWPVKDGDTPNTRGIVREEAKGHWLVRMISNNFDTRINLVDGRSMTQGTLTASTCYSGCYLEAIGKVLFYDKGASMGMTFGMDNLMMTREGESFGGGAVSAADDFGIEVKNPTAVSDFGPSGGTPERDPFGPPVEGVCTPSSGSPDPFGNF